MIRSTELFKFLLEGFIKNERQYDAQFLIYLRGEGEIFLQTTFVFVIQASDCRILRVCFSCPGRPSKYATIESGFMPEL